jgi:subtilisin family serine protease
MRSSWGAPLVVTTFFGLGGLAATEVDLDQACGEQARQHADVSPNAVRLIDADCSRVAPIETGGGFTDKNYRTQFMHGVTDLRDKSLWGQGITVGIWDAGHVLDRHVELAGRVSLGDPNRTMVLAGKVIPVPLHEHATHVAGTVGANGSVQQRAQGMAPRAKIVSFYWGDAGQDVQDLKTARALGISVTNHSYGEPGGWDRPGRDPCTENWTWLGREGETTDVRFGAYDDVAREFDEVVWQNKELSVFVAAGNERGITSDPEKFRNDPRLGVRFDGNYCMSRNGTWARSSVPRQSDLSKGGFDTITGRGLAKNVITIGAAVRLDPPFDNSQIRPTDFSSMGPVDDGRIKPDLLANGDDLYSTYLPDRCLHRERPCYPQDLTSEELVRYTTKPGTSHATPTATGIAALLNQLSQEGSRGRVLFADEMKAALVHTAKSPTNDGRPSYRWGWGLIDALQAAELIAGRAGTLTRHELELAAVQAEIKLLWDDRSSPLAFTAVWLDEPGDVAATLTIDDRTPNLVNRLEVRLISPSGNNYYPWSLTAELPDRAANNKQPNLIDNVQRIDVDAARWEAGSWRIVIKPTHWKGSKLELAIALNKAAILRKD